MTFLCFFRQPMRYLSCTSPEAGLRTPFLIVQAGLLGLSALGLVSLPMALSPLVGLLACVLAVSLWLGLVEAARSFHWFALLMLGR